MAKASKKAAVAPVSKKSEPVATMPAKAPAPKTEEPKKVEAPKPASGLFKIEGKGSTPIYIDGAMTRLPRGVAIKLTTAQQKALDNNGVKYSAA